MTEARSWLPANTCFAMVDRRIVGIVREWSRTWFGDDDVEIAADGAARWRAAKPLRCARGAWLVTSEETVAALGRCALQIEAGANETAPDQTVFDTVGEACLSALRETLVREFDLAGASSAGAIEDTPAFAVGTTWNIASRRVPVHLGFVLSEAERVELLLRLLPPPTPGPELISPGLALAPLEIELATKLGACGVTVLELKSLSPGDVLVLDRELSAPSPLAVNGEPTPRGTCTVSRDADMLVLEIIEPIIGRKS
ncbi:FliM/FliN family flagellar motor switch protein [Sphingomonas sp. BT-65]|uniref:FliM/FliN family flagellar motor switch protein n=1 Tax=Sphingomonas sp. BT-65 TaxID=2989821 RepID=UPI0022366EAC|nr:FliM/FliN family flagellar motor switch protein [Sphingomonas sp. BT-65]MCW4463802.1 FliM/FliN family flagellar motor switch protein [Sphingomonas sp. BT-65]